MMRKLWARAFVLNLLSTQTTFGQIKKKKLAQFRAFQTTSLGSQNQTLLHPNQHGLVIEYSMNGRNLPQRLII